MLALLSAPTVSLPLLFGFNKALDLGLDLLQQMLLKATVGITIIALICTGLNLSMLEDFDIIVWSDIFDTLD